MVPPSFTQRALQAVQLLAAALVGIGCHRSAEAVDRGAGISRHDSAGVVVVEYDFHRSAVRDPRLFIAPLRLPQPSSSSSTLIAYSYWHRGEVAYSRRSDGNLFAHDGDRLLLLTADGSITRVLGRAGSGPSEFRQIRAICLTRGDTGVVYDAANRRYAIVSPRFDLLWEFPAEGAMPREGCLDDGTFISLHYEVPDGGMGPRATVQRRDLRGVLINDVATAPVGILDAGVLIPSLLAANGQRIWLADAHTGIITLVSPDGVVRSVWKERTVPIRMSNSDYQRLLSQQFTDLGRRRVGLLRSAARSPKGELPTWPSFADIRSDPAGGLWASNYLKAPGDEQRWAHFDSLGALDGVFIPERTMRLSPRPLVTRFGRGTIDVAGQNPDGFWRVDVRSLTLVTTPRGNAILFVR